MAASLLGNDFSNRNANKDFERSILCMALSLTCKLFMHYI